ncbi:MAG TPA: DMT family transporter, partial [Allocoleopsis sp.]
MDFSISNGMLFAFAAMICWGFGDFLIQRSTRSIGNWNTLFFITFFGTIVLTPFVYKDIITLFQLSSYHTWIIIISAVAILFAALFDFEALKHGKLSIIEPILALEVPVTAAFSMIIANEFLGTTEIILIIIIMIGIILVSSTFEKIKSKVVLEKGVILGLLGALLMGASNFFIGYGSRITNPLLINWAIDLFMMIVCLIYIFST